MEKANYFQQSEIFQIKEVDCNDCKLNYYCCHDFHVTLSEEEVNSGLYKYKRLRPLYEKGKYLGHVWTLTRQENDYCIYFDNITRKCKIHDFKPTACKNWIDCSIGKYNG